MEGVTSGAGTANHTRASCLETGKPTISQLISNLYQVSMIFVLKVQEDGSTRTKVMTEKRETIVSTDGRDHHKPITCIYYNSKIL